MKRSSFFVRLFVGNLILIVLLLGIGGIVAYRRLNRNYLQISREEQIQQLRLATKYIQSNWAEADIDRLCKELPEQLNHPNFRLTVIAPNGNVLGDSEGIPAEMENHDTDDRPEVQAALDGEMGADRRRSATLNVPFRYMAMPLEIDGRGVAIVRLALPVEAIVEETSFISAALFWGAAVTLGSAALLGMLLSWLWYRPLRQITAAARQIASGNLTLRPHVHGSAELEELSEAINHMRETVSDQLDTISDQREHLQTILANLREGVIALDGEGHIVFMNSSARVLLAPGYEGEGVGEHFQAVIRKAEMVDLYEELTEQQPALSRQVEMLSGGKRSVLSLQAWRIAQGPVSGIRTLMVVRDVTEIARTAAMKAEFVANASHELRTPLATIRAAVDSLVDIDPTDMDAFGKFVSMLDRHVARLENMTHDLLDLHTAESPDVPTRWEDVEIGSLLWSAKSQFAPRAQEKGVELSFRAEPEEQVFRTDRKLMVLIMQNLLDNAVKFTPEGGRVHCEMVAKAGEVELAVSDTGCGIAPEDQMKVFDRFFQVEQSRAGDNRIRGTGLGLAIVKHAADRLSATIEMHSELGKGTTVRLHFPVEQEAEQIGTSSDSTT